MAHIEKFLRQGPHPLVDEEYTIRPLHEETREKVASRYAKVMRYGELKKNIPPKLKISPVTMITHKLRLY